MQWFRFRNLAALIMILSMIMLGACTQTPSSTSAPSPIPPEVTQYARDWPLPNKDYHNTRATMDSIINAGNVNTLGIAWAVPIPGIGLFGAASSTPLILGNNIYFQDLGNNILALDLASGTTRWQKIYNETNVGPNGVAVGWGKVFATIDPYKFAALDLNSGNELWSTLISNIASVGTDIQPTVYGGKVYTSTVPGSSGSNFYTGGGTGVIYALDQETGEMVWSFDTVDSKDIWGNKDVNSGGGCWYTPAIDPATGSIYWAVSNPAPWPGTKEFPNGSSRPGPNLYTNSLLTLNSDTGNLQWFTQVNPHDILDHDFQVAPILASANINGKDQDIVIGSGKMGRVYAFNRQTGAILWITIVGTHQNDQLSNLPSDNPITVYPGIFGGVETPMAYADGVVYVPVVNLGIETTSTISTLHPFSEATGELVAIDVNSGKILWQKKFDKSMNVGGATVVNDLVFTSTLDGMIYAFKRDTGEQIWSYQAPGGINAWPAVTGDTIIFPVGTGAFPALLALRLGAAAPVVTLKPIDGSTIPAGDITVSALALNFKLVGKQGQANVQGEGHLHYFMDVDAPTAQGQPAIPPSGSNWAHTDAETYTFKNVPPGTHTFSVELVNNDHTPLSTPVVARSTVTLTVPEPSVSIMFPENRATLPPGDVIISVKVNDFNLMDKQGQANVAGEGHLHYFMDVDAPTGQGQPAIPPSGSVWDHTIATTYTFKNVSTGTHTFSVELVNNDHTPLSTPVVAEVTVVISSSGGVGP
jgi:outer membrane protein assembly factor BamB